jgi:hypothetical protein
MFVHVFGDECSKLIEPQHVLLPLNSASRSARSHRALHVRPRPMTGQKSALPVIHTLSHNEPARRLQIYRDAPNSSRGGWLVLAIRSEA